MRMAKALFLALAWALAAGSGGASPSQGALQALPAPEVAAEADRSGRMRAPVYINGQGPFDFIVDTAANRSGVSARLAERLGLPLTGASDVHALSGRFSAPLVGVGSVRAGAVHLRDVELPILSRDVLADADGLLGVEAMTGRQLMMDFENERIVISDADAPFPSHTWARVNGRLRFGNLIVVSGVIGRDSIAVIVDTGAERSIGNLALRDMLEREHGRLIETATRTLNASRPIVLDEAVFIPRIGLGRVTVGNVVAAVGDAYVFSLWDLEDRPALVLGMDVLRRARAMAIDYARGDVHFLL